MYVLWHFSLCVLSKQKIIMIQCFLHEDSE